METVEVHTAINRGAGDRVLLREDRHSQSGAGRGPSPKGHDGSGVMVLGSGCKRRHCHVERRGALLVSLDRWRSFYARKSGMATAAELHENDPNL